MQVTRYERHFAAHTAAAGDHPFGTRVIEMRLLLRRQRTRPTPADVEPEGLRFREAAAAVAGDELERHGQVGGAGFVVHVHEFGDEADVFAGRDVVTYFLCSTGG